jgi:hypothetical protein
MINPQWGFNPIIIRMLFAVTLFQERGCPNEAREPKAQGTLSHRDNFKT